MLDNGLGFLPGVVLYPHAHRRLRLHDANKVARLARRFAPAENIGLENGAWLESTPEGWTNRGDPRSAFRLGIDGSVDLLDLRRRAVGRRRRVSMKAIVDLHQALAASPERGATCSSSSWSSTAFRSSSQETVTFFFWDAEPVDQVFLIHWVFGLESRQPFQRIEGTDALFLSLELPHGARIEYKFEVERGDTRLARHAIRSTRGSRSTRSARTACARWRATSSRLDAVRPRRRGRGRSRR